MCVHRFTCVEQACKTYVNLKSKIDTFLSKGADFWWSRRVTIDYRGKSKMDRLDRTGVAAGMERKAIWQISGGLIRSQALPRSPEQSR